MILSEVVLAVPRAGIKHAGSLATGGQEFSDGVRPHARLLDMAMARAGVPTYDAALTTRLDLFVVDTTAAVHGTRDCCTGREGHEMVVRGGGMTGPVILATEGILLGELSVLLHLNDCDRHVHTVDACEGVQRGWVAPVHKKQGAHLTHNRSKYFNGWKHQPRPPVSATTWHKMKRQIRYTSACASLEQTVLAKRCR